jgi:hypothetical protein
MCEVFSMEKVRSLLTELKNDEYVRFKYGKQLEVALKELDTQPSLDVRDVEARLAELLELVRGKKGGAGASPSTKSRKPAKQPAAVQA